MSDSANVFHISQPRLRYNNDNTFDDPPPVDTVTLKEYLQYPTKPKPPDDYISIKKRSLRIRSARRNKGETDRSEYYKRKEKESPYYKALQEPTVHVFKVSPRHCPYRGIPYLERTTVQRREETRFYKDMKSKFKEQYPMGPYCENLMNLYYRCMANPLKFKEEKLKNDYKNYNNSKRIRLRRIADEREILHKEIKEYYDRDWKKTVI